MKREWKPTSETLRQLANHVRLDHGNSQGVQELSKILGIHRNTVTNWVTGRSEPRDKMWERINSAARQLGFRPGSMR